MGCRNGMRGRRPRLGDAYEEGSMTSAFTVTRKNEVAIITFDVPDTKMNVLSSALASEFETLIEETENNDDIKALVLFSGKSDNFVAGADIEEFLTFKTVEDATG